MTTQQVIRAILDAATEGDLVKAEKVLEDYAQQFKTAHQEGLKVLWECMHIETQRWLKKLQKIYGTKLKNTVD